MSTIETTERDTVKVGDIFYNSWGYDQTNVDYYEVVRVTATGKSAEVMPICARVVEAHGPGGNRVVPARGCPRKWDVITGLGMNGRTATTKVCRIKPGWRGEVVLVLSDRYTASPVYGNESRYETDSQFGH